MIYNKVIISNDMVNLSYFIILKFYISKKNIFNDFF